MDENALAEAVDRELREQGQRWPPFSAGLFGDDFEAFKKARAELDKRSAEFALQW